MPPTIIEEDGPSRFDRLLKANPAFQYCIYFELRPAGHDNKQLHAIHWVKVSYMSKTRKQRFTNKTTNNPIHLHDYYQTTSSRENFLHNIMENYWETKSEELNKNLMRYPNYEEQVPFSLRHHLLKTPIRYFMLLHDFAPKSEQEEFFIVELDASPLKTQILGFRNFKKLCKKLPVINYYDNFSMFLDDFPYPSKLHTELVADQSEPSSTTFLAPNIVSHQCNPQCLKRKRVSHETIRLAQN